VANQDSNIMPYMQGNQSNLMPSENKLRSIMDETKEHRAMYPELFYKLEPFISSTCDAIEMSGVMPTQQEMDNITDDILEEFCNTYPDMANYLRANENDNSNEMPEAIPTQFFGGGFRPDRFRRFRRRGLARDIIRALLLTRLFGRRRFFF
jgi:hypothetical protein